MDQRHIKKCLIEALQEVYQTFSVQSGHELSEKQKRFINVAVKKICGKPLPKGEDFDAPPIKEAPPVVITVKPDKAVKIEAPKFDEKPFYECDICNKRCTSTSGLTLHKKLVHGGGI